MRIVVLLLLLPLIAPLMCFALGWLTWGRGFLRYQWRTIAWYYGLLTVGALTPPLCLTLLGESNALYFTLLPFTGGMLILFLYGPVCGFAMLYDYRRTHATLNPNRCRCCGYDLTGNTSGQCPECGTAIPDDQRWYLPTGDQESRESSKVVDGADKSTAFIDPSSR